MRQFSLSLHAASSRGLPARGQRGVVRIGAVASGTVSIFGGLEARHYSEGEPMAPPLLGR
jgi:hypothetical protein